MLKIEPVDTLFFRDGKPFSMGDQSAAFGIFPPYPSTVYGAIRTGVISQSKGYSSFCAGDMAAEIGTPEDITSTSLRLKGIFLCEDECIYLPAPLDLATEDEKDEKKAFRTSKRDSPPFLSNIELPSYLFSRELEKTQSVTGSFISDSDLKDYLNGSRNEFNLYQQDYFCMMEYKTGIKRGIKTRTVEEGNLYRVGMRRLRNECALVCDIEGVSSLSKRGVLKLGGEGKVVRYETVSLSLPDDREAIIEQVSQTKQFKLFLATPAIFEKGWLPDDNILKNSDYQLELLTAAIGSAFHVGGWEMAKKKNGRRIGGHKPMIRAVPSGSVYYFRIKSGKVETIYHQFHYQNIGQRAKEGFGLAFVGVI
jgi:CRISPR-associated protein Cmr3